MVAGNDAFAEESSAERRSDEEVTEETLSENASKEGRETSLPTDESGIAPDDEDAESIDTESASDSAPHTMAAETTASGVLTLRYDDRYSFSDYEDADLSGYVISEIRTEHISSYQVSGGTKTDTLDAAVVTENSGGDGMIATGVGTATVTLYKEKTESTITLSVTVEPAPLTVMFIAGQSNAEGIPSSTNGAHPEDSVLCEEGCVYSTYAPSSDSYAVSVTGLSGMSACTASNADSFVAGSLTETTSLGGSKLIYPLNALTASGNGKNGMDSGLAYEWNQLTGDKVWVVNAGWSNTSITTWVPGGSSYERARNVYQDVKKTSQAEVSAGHYTMQDTLLLWLQGEADNSMSASDYLSYFQKMYNGFQSEGLGIEYYGIVTVRANTGSRTNAEDLSMTGPRVAQYLMGNSTAYPNIYVVSNVNEQWVTDSGVKKYFQEKYGSALSYPLRSNTTLSGLPTTVSKVHGDVHYAQVAYNENGLTAAENMYYVVKGGGGTAASVCWYDPDGSALSSGASSTAAFNGSAPYVPVVTPLYLSKQVKISCSGSNLTYSTSTGNLTTKCNSSGTLKATVGNITNSISVTSPAPVLRSADAASNGTKITWDAVPGATGYSVHRKASGGSWSTLGTTTSTSYTDKTALTNGTTYYYTVRAYAGTESKAAANKYSASYWSSYDAGGLKAVYIKTPTLNSATNASNGIKVSWSAVSGATGYSVHRKTSGGSWTTLGTTTSTSYTDKTAKPGTTYYYTVRAYRGSAATSNKYNAQYWSGYKSSGISAKYISAPVLKSAKAVAGGTQVSWSSVSGAKGYAVFRKQAGGSWKRLTTTTSTSYTDKASLKNKTTYYYTVRAYTGTKSKALANTYSSSYWSSYDSAGLESVYIKTPTLKKATNSSKGIKVSWSAVNGATGYSVHRKTPGGSWTTVGTTTSTSYTDKTAKAGTTYYYTVRAYRGSAAASHKYDAKYWSGYDSAGIRKTRE